MNKGILFAAGAYVLWGFLPIFWKQLETVPASEILAHRMVWSLAFLVLLLTKMRHWKWLRFVLSSRKTFVTFLVTASLLGLNWFTYIWSVNHGQIVATSLGYFITPLVNMLLGMVFLGERVRNWQRIAIAVAVGGVSWLAISYGAAPWIALTLAFTFGFYGLLRKTAALSALEGLTLEMTLLFLPASSYLLYLWTIEGLSFGAVSPITSFLLVLSGIFTAVPLLLFAIGARRIQLVTLGLLQFIAPTMQFLIGVFVYGEPFTEARLIGFVVIWIALLIYSAEAVMFARQEASLAANSRVIAQR